MLFIAFETAPFSFLKEAVLNVASRFQSFEEAKVSEGALKNFFLVR